MGGVGLAHAPRVTSEQGPQKKTPVPGTRAVGMAVRKDNLGFGERSWRYAAIIDDGVVEAFMEEPGRCDNCPDDPYGASSPEAVLEWLRAHPRGRDAA